MNVAYSRGVSSIATTAALSVALLIAATGWYMGRNVSAQTAARIEETQVPQAREYVPLADANGNGTPDWQEELLGSGIAIATSSPTSTAALIESDPASSLGSRLLGSLASGYLSLKEYDQYTPERGDQLAETLASGFRAPTLFVPHTRDALTLDPDTSPARMLEYRADMRATLAPMVDFNAEPEFSLFARFIQTGDRSWLEKLSKVTNTYRSIEQSLLKVEVPVDAADVHLRATNALGVFTETLERLIRFSDDPLAQMALLRTYNDAEREFFLAFDALAKFYVEKIGN